MILVLSWIIWTAIKGFQGQLWMFYSIHWTQYAELSAENSNNAIWRPGGRIWGHLLSKNTWKLVYRPQKLFLSLALKNKVRHHNLPHFFRTVRKCGAAQCGCGWTLKFFIAFLDELGNSKPFETYLFFGSFWSEKCGPHSTALCGQVRTAQCGQIWQSKP